MMRRTITTTTRLTIRRTHLTSRRRFTESMLQPSGIALKKLMLDKPDVITVQT